MAHDEELLDRLREQLAGKTFAERAMFGGVVLMVDGHMAVAASRSGELMVRVEPGESEALLGPGVRRVEMRGREMAGWLSVGASALSEDAALARWVALSLTYVRTVPPR